LLTGSGAWGAIAQVGASLNLFNLIPFWQLDGARGFQALTSGQRGLAVGAVASVMLPSGQGLLVLIAAVGAWKALRGGARTPNWRVWAIFVALIGSLSWLATLNVPVPVGLS
jgi:Zn-dependent protease